MTDAILLGLVAAASAVGAHLLARAHWTWRTPRTSIVLWQALGLAWGVATIGALLGIAVAPYRIGVVDGLISFATAPSRSRLGLLQMIALTAGLTFAAVLVGVLLVAITAVVRARRRHRALLALVAHGDPDFPGTLVLDHPIAAAYCGPGVRSKVVVSAGTLELLGPYELAAVLAHERAHARERHDLVLLPFASLRRAFPQASIIARTLDSVELLIEMAADDRARRHRPAKELATALLRFAAARPAQTPVGTLGAAGAVRELSECGAVLARVHRLLEPAPLPRAVRATMLSCAVVVAVLPVVLCSL